MCRGPGRWAEGTHLDAMRLGDLEVDTRRQLILDMLEVPVVLPQIPPL